MTDPRLERIISNSVKEDNKNLVGNATTCISISLMSPLFVVLGYNVGKLVDASDNLSKTMESTCYTLAGVSYVTAVAGFFAAAVTLKNVVNLNSKIKNGEQALADVRVETCADYFNKYARNIGNALSFQSNLFDNYCVGGGSKGGFIEKNERAKVRLENMFSRLLDEYKLILREHKRNPSSNIDEVKSVLKHNYGELRTEFKRLYEVDSKCN